MDMLQWIMHYKTSVYNGRASEMGYINYITTGSLWTFLIQCFKVSSSLFGRSVFCFVFTFVGTELGISSMEKQTKLA